ncbi:hypothetical protein BD413DRAFT_94527 [Trametes elegans]|nr:hypothetical protein BD413DRAFT_94527 [Trametes elegans]
MLFCSFMVMSIGNRCVFTYHDSSGPPRRDGHGAKWRDRLLACSSRSSRSRSHRSQAPGGMGPGDGERVFLDRVRELRAHARRALVRPPPARGAASAAGDSPARKHGLRLAESAELVRVHHRDALDVRCARRRGRPPFQAGRRAYALRLTGVAHVDVLFDHTLLSQNLRPSKRHAKLTSEARIR